MHTQTWYMFICSLVILQLNHDNWFFQMFIIYNCEVLNRAWATFLLLFTNARETLKAFVLCCTCYLHFSIKSPLQYSFFSLVLVRHFIKYLYLLCNNSWKRKAPMIAIATNLNVFFFFIRLKVRRTFSLIFCLIKWLRFYLWFLYSCGE